MKLRELWGIPIPGTEKAVGLKKVSTVLQYGGASKYLVFFTKAILTYENY